MADPLLTSLCSVCHLATPKYKCPRCQTRTCSFSCVKKHKAWSSCDGRRDQTAYVPIEKLKTAAGIDHDYNFLSSIERSVERSERTIIDDRRLLEREEIRPLPPVYVLKRVRQRLPNGKLVDRQIRVPLPPAVKRRRDPLADHQLRWRIEKLEINIIRAPTGIGRRKENKTRWERYAKSIDWTVEWLLLDPEVFRTKDGRKPTTRIVHRALESDPLAEAFTKTVDWYEKAFTPRSSGGNRGWKQRAAAQDTWTSEWANTGQCRQDPDTTTWLVGAAQNDPRQGSEEELKALNFFLGRPNTPANQPKTLVPLKSSDTLATVLVGETILEFPTIYVLSAHAGLPDGYVLKACPDSLVKRRKRAAVDVRESTPLKKPRLDEAGEIGSGEESEEEVEIIEDDEILEAELLENGEIVEDLDIEDPEESPTSSSGSDGSISDVELSGEGEAEDEADV